MEDDDIVVFCVCFNGQHLRLLYDSSAWRSELLWRTTWNISSSSLKDLLVATCAASPYCCHHALGTVASSSRVRLQQLQVACKYVKTNIRK